MEKDYDAKSKRKNPMTRNITNEVIVARSVDI